MNLIFLTLGLLLLIPLCLVCYVAWCIHPILGIIAAISIFSGGLYS